MRHLLAIAALGVLLLGCGSSRGDDDVVVADGAVVDGAVTGDAALPPICSDLGRKAIQFRSSPVGDWRLALEASATYQELALTGAPTAVAAAFDLAGAGVSGFIVALPASQASPSAEVNALNARILGASGVAPGSILSSGAGGRSLDDHDTVRGVMLGLDPTSSSDASSVRNAIVARIVQTSTANVGNAPGPLATTSTRFVVAYQVLVRDATTMLVLGAVTTRAGFDDATRSAGWQVEDLSNGTALARANNDDLPACETHLVDRVPRADILWMLDESGSTSDDRMRIEAHATQLFARAVAQGLDFRMGVTDLDDASLGKLSRGAAATPGYGAWILPGEPAVFIDAVRDPSGTKAADGAAEHGLTQLANLIRFHTPRSATDPLMVRPGAALAVIIQTDEWPEELAVGGTFPLGGSFTGVSFSDQSQALTAAQQAELETRISPFIAYAKTSGATVHAIVTPTMDPACAALGSSIGWGYFQLAAGTSGQSASICQADLSTTITRILDSINGAASPVVLRRFPISSSLAVARDGVALSRSRSAGFDYQFASNALVFFGVPFDPRSPSEVTVSYRSYRMQRPVD